MSMDRNNASAGTCFSRATANNASFDLPPAPVEVSLPLDGQSYTWQGTLSRYDGADFEERYENMMAEVMSVFEPPTASRLHFGEKGEGA